jgi:hypothetical protein
VTADGDAVDGWERATRDLEEAAAESTEEGVGITASSDANEYSVTRERSDYQAFDPTVFQDEYTHLIVANGDVVEIPINIAVKCGEAR